MEVNYEKIKAYSLCVNSKVVVTNALTMCFKNT